MLRHVVGALQHRSSRLPDQFRQWHCLPATVPKLHNPNKPHRAELHSLFNSLYCIQLAFVLQRDDALLPEFGAVLPSLVHRSDARTLLSTMTPSIVQKTVTLCNQLRSCRVRPTTT